MGNHVQMFAHKSHHTVIIHVSAVFLSTPSPGKVQYNVCCGEGILLAWGDLNLDKCQPQCLLEQLEAEWGLTPRTPLFWVSTLYQCLVSAVTNHHTLGVLKQPNYFLTVLEARNLKSGCLATSLSLFTFLHWRRKWQPTPVFLPGESQGQGSLVAAIYGVTQSRTWLKWLSSSSSNWRPEVWNQGG